MKFSVPTYSIDSNSRLSMTAFMRYAQEVADEGSRGRGFGYNDLKAHGLTWVLSRMKVVVDRMPDWQEEVELSTWHKGFDRLFFPRDYELSDKDGNVLVRATSAWLIVDFNTHEMVRDDERIADLTVKQPEKDRNALPGGAERIPSVQDGIPMGSHTVVWSDIDRLGHSNNSSYVSWTFDIIKEKSVREIEMNFVSQTFLGDRVDFYGKTSEDGRLILEARVGDKPVYRASLL